MRKVIDAIMELQNALAEEMGELIEVKIDTASINKLTAQLAPHMPAGANCSLMSITGPTGDIRVTHEKSSANGPSPLVWTGLSPQDRREFIKNTFGYDDEQLEELLKK